MLSLFKKKGSKASVGLYDSRSEYGEVDPMLVWGTAPPSYGECYEDLEEKRDKGESYVTKSYLVSAQLEVSANQSVEKTNDMLKILDIMVDEYDGSYLCKPLIVSTYLTIGTHLRKISGGGKNNYRYGNGFTEVIEITGEADIHPKELEIKYNKYLSTTHKGDNVSISYQFSCKKSKRKGKNIMDAYSLELANGTSPPDLKDIIEFYEIKIRKDSNGILGFCNAHSK
ncbi:matrix protein [Hayes Yard virus]|uniref:Matrix protein n=1 Tax=Hayes Yard virus TaxID=2602440 RepID=A0A7D0N1S4_9RHAB|nr:matrix protein [Hayes Yard virus]QEA08652.1 matrix protein [Hayes Yard virus]